MSFTRAARRREARDAARPERPAPKGGGRKSHRAIVRLARRRPGHLATRRGITRHGVGR